MFTPFLLRHNTSCAAEVINFVIVPDVGHQCYVDNCSPIDVFLFAKRAANLNNHNHLYLQNK